MGHCSLSKRVCLSWAVGWDTVLSSWVGHCAWAEGDTYMRVDGGDTLPGVECPPLPQVNSDCVHGDEIGEIVFSIHLKDFQKLPITRLFPSPLS